MELLSYNKRRFARIKNKILLFFIAGLLIAFGFVGFRGKHLRALVNFIESFTTLKMNAIEMRTKSILAFFNINDASLVTWSHAVNSKEKLRMTLEG